MSREAGARIGPYEIISPLGAGGMGEVYRARDPKLGRDVALKVLPAGLVHDPERVARQQREAQMLAALKHPHIATIHGMEDAADGSRFLVLELVEGGTLAQRLAASGALPVDEAVAIARQVAEALEAAHEKGIIHRDLKPSNIAFTADGQVKVLDFGLAKLADPAGSGQSSVGGSPMSMSPTITTPALMTGVGVLLGTAAYMSPEQARGREADKRSDIWAFGCVLYEMLTGRRAFEGEDVSDTLAGILRGEPSWRDLPANLPPALSTLVHRCLQRDAKARIADSSVIRFLLDNPAEAAAPPAVAPLPVNRLRALAPWIVAAALAIAYAATLFLRPSAAGPSSSALVRMNVDVGGDVAVQNILGANAVLSPDGTLLAFVATAAGGSQPQLYVRRLDQLEAAPLAGTESPVNPFFSPDGNWIAFFAQGKLKKVSITGGAAVTLCDAANPRGGSWGDDDTIVFQPVSTPDAPLMRVAAAGGMPQKLIPTQNQEAQRWPQLLPGSNVVIFTAGNPNGGFEEADVVAQRLPDGPRVVLQKGGFYGRYVRSGHLLYMHQGTVFAAPMDAERLAVTGQPVPALEKVAGSPANGGVQLAVSDSGTMVYISGEAITNTSPIEWMDATGKVAPLRAMPSDWSNPSFSPDGTLLAIDISDGAQSDVWVYDWARDTLSRLTFDPTDDQRPVWTPDGKRIVFASKRADKATFNLYWQRADGTGDVQRLTTSPNQQLPSSWHPGGKVLGYLETAPTSGTNVMTLPVAGDEVSGWKPGTPTAFLSAPYTESTPMFSPDGRWVAYLSNESGRNELYVRPFPGPGGKWQISNGVADDPNWSRTRPELIFAQGNDNGIYVSTYTVGGDSFRADKPTPWTTAQFLARPRPPSRDFDLHPDGKRLAVAAGNTRQGAPRLDKVTLVFNFDDELRRITSRGN